MPGICGIKKVPVLNCAAKLICLKFDQSHPVRRRHRREQSCSVGHCQLFRSQSFRRLLSRPIISRDGLVICVVSGIVTRLLQHACPDLGHFAAGHHQRSHLSVFSLGLALQVERHAVDAGVEHAHHDQRRPEIAHLESAHARLPCRTHVNLYPNKLMPMT